MTRRDKNSVEFIYCYCGCQRTKPKYDNWGRQTVFLAGHNNRGKSGLKGGTHITNGYKFILRKNHRFADSKGYVPEHRLVFEEYHKCSLLPFAAVHHKDGNKLNNNIFNLAGMTKRQHKQLHGKQSSHLENHIKTRTYIKNQFGVWKMKKFRMWEE